MLFGSLARPACRWLLALSCGALVVASLETRVAHTWSHAQHAMMGAFALG
jgi:hypothetical protein